MDDDEDFDWESDYDARCAALAAAAIPARPPGEVLAAAKRYHAWLLGDDDA